MDQIIISAGAALCIAFWLQKAAPAIAAAVCGWMYPEFTCLLLAVFLVFSLRKQPKKQEVNDDIIDAEFEVLS